MLGRLSGLYAPALNAFDADAAWQCGLHPPRPPISIFVIRPQSIRLATRRDARGRWPDFFLRGCVVGAWGCCASLEIVGNKGEQNAAHATPVTSEKKN